MADHDLHRLPKWAQSRIAVLENRVQHLESKLNEGPEESDTFADPYGTFAPGDNQPSGRPLGEGTIVRFWLGDDRRYKYVDVSAKVTGRGKHYVNVHGGEGALSVRPSSSNVVEITVTDL